MGFIYGILERFGTFFLFLLLLCISLTLTLQRNLYHSSAFNAKIICIKSNVNDRLSSITDYFSLREENQKLVEENRKLQSIVFNTLPKDSIQSLVFSDSSQYQQAYKIISAEVIDNSVSFQNNFISLNKGSNDGVSVNAGIISDKGIVGIITTVTPKYSGGLSLLHKETKINARLKNTQYFGTLAWEGEDTRIMHLADIPKYVPLQLGDTIETDNKSEIFPEGIAIGTISSYKIDKKEGNWDIAVELFQKPALIRKVYIVEDLKKWEKKELKDSLGVEQPMDTNE